MADRPSVLNTGQWGVETVLGTQVASNRRLLCTMFEPDPNIPTTPYRPTGYVANTTAVQGKESTAAALSGVLCYNDLVYLLSSLLVKVNPTIPGGATNTRRWTFTPSSTALDTFASYTLEKGSITGQAERLVAAVVNNLTMRWTRADANLTGSIMGQVLTESQTPTGGATEITALPIDPKSVSVFVGTTFNTNNVQTVTITGTPTGGTFTLTYSDGGAQTTGPIAFNAVAGTVQTALQALTNLGTNVTVGGGPGPGTPYTVTFAGLYAGVNASLLTANSAALTGGSSPTVTVTNTTPGGMTRLTRCLSCELAIPDRFVFPFTLNDADPSWSFAVQQGVDPRCTIEVEHDTVAAAFMNNLRGRATLYCKILARGSVIETTFPNALQITFPFKFIENTRGDTDGVYRSTFPMALMVDPSPGFGGWLSAVVDNSLTAL